VTESGGQVDGVRRFYDRNTPLFRRLGEGRTSIHRAVWGPGAADRAAAFHYVEERLLAVIADVERPRVVDLGCGVGGSLLHLAARRDDLSAEGLTISGAQVEAAAGLVAEAGLTERVRVRQGDFLAPPDDLVGADLVFSIEAFVHGPDPAAYFRAAAGLLRPGGLLALCDDLLTPAGAAPTPEGRRRLDDFRSGWRVGSLVTVEEAVDLAADAGLAIVDDDDLTPWLELGRPRDRAIRVLVGASRPLRPSSEYWRSLSGGDALQRCLGAGLVDYRLLVLRRGQAA
jgi:cyclopropane fatty-acyl-phospholipid synthase-like methyltransferase